MTKNNSGADTPAGDSDVNLTAQGFDNALGLDYDHISAESVTATVRIESRHCQPFGIVHGGVYCSIAESVASVSGTAWLSASDIGGTVVGVNNNTDFLRAISSGHIVTATSHPIHRGRRQQLWQVDIADDSGRVVAQGRVRLQNLPASAPSGHERS